MKVLDILPCISFGSTWHIMNRALELGIAGPQSQGKDRTTGELWIPDTARSHDLECPGQ